MGGLRAVQVLAFTTVRVRSATGMSLLALLPAAARISTTASCVMVDSPAQEQVVTMADSAALPTTLALLLAGTIRVRWVVMGLRALLPAAARISTTASSLAPSSASL